MSTIISLDTAAATLGCTPKTIRYQLARAEKAGQPFARKPGRDWILYATDLDALRNWIVAARATSGFQPGNRVWTRGKPGRPKKIAANSSNGKRKPAKDLRKSAKAKRKK